VKAEAERGLGNHETAAAEILCALARKRIYATSPGSRQADSFDLRCPVRPAPLLGKAESRKPALARKYRPSRSPHHYFIPRQRVHFPPTVESPKKFGRENGQLGFPEYPGQCRWWIDEAHPEEKFTN
jgi:hypothetical protein